MTRQNITFAELAARSLDDAPPDIEVVDRVLATISASLPPVVSDRPLMWLAALSSAAALVVAPGLYGELLSDPLGTWLSSLTVVLQ
jgi:hypothetical protein